ncbi:hypothetical protein FPV67DRAFT_1445583 [Lyophyllum atratum]|nr:hypothetical protein FPV67DRAFT_1445583 [Lyophyllum atratum]
MSDDDNFLGLLGPSSDFSGDDLRETTVPERFSEEPQTAPIRQEGSSRPDVSPPSTEVDDIRDFFEYSLPTLVMGEDHTRSRSTRAPAHFDRHLDEHLRMDRVVYLPAFLTDLKAIAEDALTKYTSKFPFPATREQIGFPNAGIRLDCARDALEERILNERSLEGIYSKTMASHCSIVASTLEFQLPVWSSAHLHWQTIHGRSEEKHAIADGLLRIFDISGHTCDAARVSPLAVEYLDVRKYFPVIGVWEFKNMVAGSINVFEAILEQAKMHKFPWVGCQEGNRCAVVHPPTLGKVLKTWSKMGPDASESVVPPPTMPPPPSHPIRGTDIQHGLYMVQQVIAEMVKHDTTFGCLHSGHSEIYFKRDRKNKILYVSDIVRTDAPGHGGLITGLFIAMLRDAKERSAQMKHGFRTWPDCEPPETPSAGLSPEGIIEQARIRQWLILTPEEKGILTSSFCPGSPYLRSPSVAIGATDFDLDSAVVSISIPPQRHTSKGTLSISGTVFPGIRGRYSKFVVVRCANRDRDVVRLRKEDQAYRDLAAAGVTCIPQLFGLFVHANSEGDPRIKLPYASLVIEDVGDESLEDWWKSERSFPESTVQDALKALKQFHSANYCHGKLALHDILILPEDLRRDDRSPISFVSLRGAYQTTQAWEKEKELEALEGLLRNPLKHQLTGAKSDDSLDDEESDDPHISQRPRFFASETTSSIQIFISRRATRFAITPMSHMMMLAVQNQTRDNESSEVELESSERQSKFQPLPTSTVWIPFLLMQYNPPLQSPDLDPDDPETADVCPSLTAPSIFYDKHLDEKLLMKSVRVIPLATNISRTVNVTSQSLIARKVPISPHRPMDSFPSQEFRSSRSLKVRIKDAQSLAEVYQRTIGLYSSVISSMFLLHPRADEWDGVLHWGCTGSRNWYELEAFSQNYGLKILDGDQRTDKLQGSIDEQTRETLRIMKQRDRALAYWSIFAISKEAEDVLEGMNVATWADNFPYELCNTKGYSTPPDIQFNIPDASTTGWGVSVSSIPTLPVAERISTIAVAPQLAQVGEVTTPAKEISLRRSSRLCRPIATTKGKSKGSPANRGEAVEARRTTTVLWPKITLPARPLKSNKTSEMACLFLQRAWALSVEHNTTYTVFHCGNFERIGFRHRSSQTLFLSELIRVPECKNPGYGKIHMGLFLSIVQDVLDRTELERQQEETPRSSDRKRRRGTSASNPNKRYTTKTRAMALKERSEADERNTNQEIVKKDARERSLMLLELRYGVYNSAAPASFLRTHSIQHDTYGPEEYLSIVLTSRIAGGATGVVHGAILRLLSSDGEVRSVDVVVKLSFKSEQREHLRHEHTVYEHLATRGVEGIPFVYGLFEDVETDTIALVMSHVGTALKTLLPDHRSYGRTISKSARAAYLRVLGDIHDAGVRHRDIRPENLTLHDDDSVAIIDFDMAELNPSEGAKRREMRHITDLLNGFYSPPNEFPSMATTPEKEAALEKPRSYLPRVDEDQEDQDQISCGGVANDVQRGYILPDSDGDGPY